MRNLVIRGILTSLIALTPFAAMAPRGVMAQVAPLDEATRATVVAMTQRVGAMISPGIVAPEGQVKIPITPTPEVIEEPIELPPLNLTDLVEYSSQGITFQAPADWIVETDSGEDVPFTIEVPGTDLVLSMEADAELDFPSWLGVALFRSQAALLITELGDNAQLEESTTLYTPQSLPIAKLAFSGVDDEEAAAGALYVMAPNENAYLVIAGGPEEDWAYAQPGVDLIVKSITFDEDLFTVVMAGDEPLLFTDEDETVEVSVPAGWYAIGTGDPQFPVILGEPEVRYVTAIGTAASFGEGFDADMLEEFIPADGELSEEDSASLIDSIVEMIGNSGSPINLDEDLSQVATREGAVTVRLVGDAELGDGLGMPVVLYIDLRTDGVGVVVVFGDTESALAVEDVIQTLLESVTGL
jgi:hypothetical protein